MRSGPATRDHAQMAPGQEHRATQAHYERGQEVTRLAATGSVRLEFERTRQIVQGLRTCWPTWTPALTARGTGEWCWTRRGRMGAFPNLWGLVLI